LKYTTRIRIELSSRSLAPQPPPETCTSPAQPCRNRRAQSRLTTAYLPGDCQQTRR
jgi:hypothetical protein